MKYYGYQQSDNMSFDVQTSEHYFFSSLFPNHKRRRGAGGICSSRKFQIECFSHVYGKIYVLVCLSVSELTIFSCLPEFLYLTNKITLFGSRSVSQLLSSS